MTPEKRVKNLIDQIVQGYQPEKIILFGSSARSAPRPESDIDLAVIKETKAKFPERLKQIARIAKTWEPVDILVYTPQEWQQALAKDNYFIKEISKTGKVVYEK